MCSFHMHMDMELRPAQGATDEPWASVENIHFTWECSNSGNRNPFQKHRSIIFSEFHPHEMKEKCHSHTEHCFKGFLSIYILNPHTDPLLGRSRCCLPLTKEETEAKNSSIRPKLTRPLGGRLTLSGWGENWGSLSLLAREDGATGKGRFSL